MKNNEYYVIIDKSIKLDNTKRQRINKVEIILHETKIPFSDKIIDIYDISANKKDCENFIEKLDNDIQEVFKIVQLNGDPKYTAFLDILGFSQHIKKHITNDHEAEQFYHSLGKIIEHLEFMKEEKYEIENAHLLNDMEINYSWISDTFVITIGYYKDIKEEERIIKGLMLFKLSMIVASLHHFIANNYGLLLRGAISSKYSCITNNLILGEGITESAKLEKYIAIYPRVIFEQSIINDEIYETISRHYSNNNLNYISKDCDGYYFVNYVAMLQYIPPMIGKTTKILENKLKEVITQNKIDILIKYQEMVANGLKEDNEKIKAKYIWFNNYLGRVLLEKKFENNIIDHQ